MGGRDATCKLLPTLRSLLLLWLGLELMSGGSWSCHGLDQHEGMSLIEAAKIRNYLSDLASDQRYSPAVRKFTFHATDCSEAVNRAGRTRVTLKFPGELRALLSSGRELSHAELEVRPPPGGATRGDLSPWLRWSRGSLRYPYAPALPRDDDSFTQDSAVLDATAHVQRWLNASSHSWDNRRFRMKIDLRDLHLGSNVWDVCSAVQPRAKLRVILQEGRDYTPRFKRGSDRASSGSCQRRSVRVNVSRFVNGFQPSSVGPDGRTELYFCQGSCRNPQVSLIANQWTQIKAMAHTEDRNFPAPYCAAVEWGSLEGVQLQPDGTFFTHRIPSIVVTRCQCV